MTTAQLVGLIPYGVVLSSSLFLIGVAWRFRNTPGGTGFIVMLCAHVLVTAGYLAELVSPSLSGKLMADDYQYLGGWLTPVAFFILSLEYTRTTRIRPDWWLMVAISLLLMMSLVYSNPLHGLVRSDERLLEGGLYDVLIYRFGPVAWLYTLWSYGWSIASFALLLRAMLSGNAMLRSQAGLILLGAMIPVFGAVFSLSGLTIQRDITPITFGLMYLPVGYALFRNRFLDLLPLARDLVIDSMEEHVYVFDFDGRLLDVNRAAKLGSGLDPRQVVGQSARRLFPGENDWIDRLDAETDISLETSFSSDPLNRTFDLRLKAIEGEDGTPRGRLLVLRDVTEQKAHEREREKLIEDLDAFAQIVAHDLKNPLASVIAYCDLLSMPDLPQEKRLDLAQRALYSAEHLNLIIDGLLMLSRQRHAEPAPLHPVDMALILEESLDALQGQIRASQAQIELPAQWPQVHSYGPWLVQVWANLISNAIKYGGKPPRVHIEVESAAGGWLRFCVRDNGPGIDPEDRHRIFTRYERLGRLDQRGHGLGLSIVHRIIERLGGTVGVESAPGQGSCFYFRLPAPAEELR